jgi:hypothetical protein
MNRRDLFRSALGAAMLAVAQRLGFGSTPDLVDDGCFAYQFEFYSKYLGKNSPAGVCVDVQIESQPWGVSYVTKTRAELERDYP